MKSRKIEIVASLFFLFLAATILGCSKEGNSLSDEKKLESSEKIESGQNVPANLNSEAVGQNILSGCIGLAPKYYCKEFLQHTLKIKVPENCLVPKDKYDKTGRCLNCGLNPMNRPECAEVKEAIQKILRRKEEERRKREAEKRRAEWEKIKKEYEELPALDPPKITRLVPKVSVKYLGLRKGPPIKGDIIDAFNGADENYYYLVTEDSIYVMGPGDRIRKRIRKKPHSIYNRYEGGVYRTLDAQWLWYEYIPEEQVNQKDAYDFTRTVVYDRFGNFWWDLEGMIDSISPDGERAVLVLPESGGFDYIEKDDGEKKHTLNTLRNIDGPGKSCFFKNSIVFVTRSKIVVLDPELNITMERKLLTLTCKMQACISSMNRVVATCFTAKEDGTSWRILLLFDNNGKELARSWFPHPGNVFTDIDWKKNRILVMSDTGETFIIDLKTNEIVFIIDRFEYIPKQLKRKEFSGDKTQFLYAKSKRDAEVSTKPLVSAVLYYNDAIFRFKRPLRFTDAKERKNPTLEIVDLSGSVLLSMKIRLTVEKESKYDLMVVKPVVWRDKNIIKIKQGSKLMRFAVERGDRQ